MILGIRTILPYLLLFIVNPPSLCNRITSKIYIDLDDRHFCFLRLNATHQIGCSSSESNSGTVKVIRQENFAQDLSYVTSNGPDPPYVAVISSRLFNLSTLNHLKHSSFRVSGVIVLDDNRPNAFSSDRSCPNEVFSLYANDAEHKFCSKQEWNKPTSDHVESILFNYWPFPIFLIRNKTEIEMLLNKAKEHDNWPKLAAQIVSPMSAAVDSRTCIRRSNSWYFLSPVIFCDPLGGSNIYGHTFNFTANKTINENSVIMLVTRLDSFSMFNDLAPGSDSVMSSLMVVLSVAELLNRPVIREKMYNAPNRSLFIALFDGEAFDYIGSGQAAFQMKHNIFPIYTQPGDDFNFNLSHLLYFIELDQVAYYGQEPFNIYLHKHLKSNVNELIKLFKQESHDLIDLKINETPDDMPLPPSSVQSFLKLRDDLKAVVITNHQNEYINKHYNSFYEDGSDINKKSYIIKMKALSTLIGRVIYKLVTDDNLEQEANITILDMAYECFLKTSSCKLYDALNSNNKSSESQNEPPFSSYVSVYKRTNLFRSYVKAALNYFTGEKLAISIEECLNLSKNDPAHNYLFQNGFSMNGECVRSTVYVIDSISPAFEADSLDLVDDMLKNNTYPAWTESKWKKTSLMIFVVSSQLQQWLILFLGLVLMFISMVAVVYLSHYFEFYFDTFMGTINDYAPATAEAVNNDNVDEGNPNMQNPPETDCVGTSTGQNPNSSLNEST